MSPIKQITTLACIILLALTPSSVLARKWKTPSDPSNWMHDIKSSLYQYPIVDITLPGTHDSATYQLDNVVGPGNPPDLVDLIKLANDFGFDIYEFINRWSQTQNMTFYQQLENGIRYLDLRACWANNGWYAQHFLLGVPIQTLLDDIARFVDTHIGEVVVVEVGDLNGASYANQISLVQMIENTLGPRMFRWEKPWLNTLASTPIGELVKKKTNLVVLYPNIDFAYNNPFLWLSNAYAEGCYANSDKLNDMEGWNKWELSSNGNHGRIFELSWTLTTQPSEIEKVLLDPFTKVKNLKDLALQADAALQVFLENHTNWRPGNILLVDWFEYTNVVGIAYEYNLRQCFDDPAFAAYNPNGHDCRSYAGNHNCTQPQHKQWMEKHCRLSCGYC